MGFSMASPSFAPRLAFVAAATSAAREARKALEKRYGAVQPAEADIIVALGGDGLMLQVLHRHMKRPTPIFGMNLGTVGFLLNIIPSSYVGAVTSGEILQVLLSAVLSGVKSWPLPSPPMMTATLQPRP